MTTSLQERIQSASRPPLPQGASTEETLAQIADNTQYLPKLATTGVPVDGTVALDAATLSALETVNVGNFPVSQPISGTVALDVPTLAALETINVGNLPATQPISAASLPLPTGAATAALQTQPGTDIGDVTVNNASGAGAVNVQDGGNSLTVDNSGTFVVQNTGSDATNTLQAVAQKKLSVSTYSPSTFQNLGANATLNVKSSAGNVFSLSCYNANASTRFIQLHNTATTPSGGAVPIFSFLVPSSSQIIIGADFFTNEGVNFSTGIAFAFSTTINTYTAGSAGDQSTFIQYK